MAIPQIDVSTRRLEIAPDRHYAPSVWGEIGQMAGDTGRLLAGTFDRIAEVREREAERRRLLEERNARALDADARRQAEYNQMLANNFIANNAIGYETVDEKTGQRSFVPGRLSKSRAEMTAEGTDSVKLTRQIMSEMREQDWYKNMTPDVRRHFDRQFIFTQDKWMRNAAENDINARNQERVETMKKLIAERAKGVQSLYGMDDQTFLRGATNASFRNMLDLEASGIENPQIFENIDITPQNAKEAFAKIKWRSKLSEKQLQEKYNRILEGVGEFAVNRITALTKAAAANQSLGAMNPDQCLAKAEDIADGLRKTFFIGNNPATGKPCEILTETEHGAILGEIEVARRNCEGIKTYETRKKREDKIRDVVKSELSIRDVPQEQWANNYETLGRDPVLRELDPQRAMAYLDTAREMREAKEASKVKAAKAARDANEEALALSLSRLQVLELDDSIGEDGINEAQAAIWRKFRVEAMKGGLSASFIRSFQGRLVNRLSDQEKDAMRKLYSAFGFTGELSSDGRISASDRKAVESESFYAPRSESEPYQEEGKKISGKDLFLYGEAFLRTLRTLGPDVNREGVVEKEIARLKTDWVRSNFAANRDAAVKNILDISRELKTAYFLNNETKKDNKDNEVKNGESSSK